MPIRTPIPHGSPFPVVRHMLTRLLALLRAHADVVRDSVWGHHHTPSVRLVVDGSSGAAVHTMYLSPSLTPSGRRPSFLNAASRACA